MKSIFTLLTILLLSANSFAQKLDYETDSKWYIGLNAGATWSTLDVKSKTHLGYGFVLGRSLNYDYGKIFSFDIRLRYLRGKWYGQDYKSTDVNLTNYSADNPVFQEYQALGHTYNNFEADVHHIGLEFAVHFNKLIERTGFDPYIFGGANIVLNQTYGDLFNQDSLSSTGLGSTYNYIAGDISRSELNGLVDGIYDTPLLGSSKKFKANFMPSFGIGLAYQVGPRFSIGVEHLMTFTLTDDFDGFRKESVHWGLFKNDVYHYSGLSLKFNFRKSGTKSAKPNTTQNSTPPPPPTERGCDKPKITSIQPKTTNLVSPGEVYAFEAKVEDVESKDKISTTLNGETISTLKYEPIDEILSGDLNLKKGTNNIIIIATNECGTTTKTIAIKYECKIPVVFMLQPTMQKTVVNSSSYSIRAEISYSENIEFLVNGIPSDNFIYSESDKVFVSTQNLNKGETNFTIKATNSCGTSEQKFVLDYNNCVPPVLSINQSSEAIISDNPNYNYYATVSGVIAGNQITVTANGRPTPATYTNGNITGKTVLKEGQNVILITAQNECGKVSKMISIDYQKEPRITVCLNGNPMTILQSQWATYQSQGATLGQCPQVDPQITICLRGNTMNVLQSQWATYQSQGATLGQCPQVDPQITICLRGNTMTILESQWSQYKIQGATLGECPVIDNNITICFNRKQMTILESQWEQYQRLGATMGDCPELKITICHKPPGNPTNTQEISIPESAWPAHEAHGDTRGRCETVKEELTAPKPLPTRKITICFNGETISIPTTEWLMYQSQGAVKGECSEEEVEETIEEEPNGNKKITICHKPPGNPTNTQEISIPESAWPAHEAHGDTKGKCETVKEELTAPKPLPTRKITICFNGETTSIPTTEWLMYQSQGAVKGECPEEEVEETNEEESNENKKITICHKPPGNPTNTQEISIPESAWPAHEAHGDTQGPCPVEDKLITICMNIKGKQETKEIKESEWLLYKSRGAKRGACK